MPFAHCIDCGTSALIDPSGRCPEGHEVGAAGARVASAIGSAGPHPDEPLPWVGTVDLDPAVLDAAPPEPRVARPPSVPTNDLTVGVPAAPGAAPAGATDELLRELHALGDFGDLAAPAATPPAVAPPAAAPPAAAPPAAAPPAPAPLQPPMLATGPTAPPPTPITRPAPGAVAAGSPAPPSSPEEATDLDELASLAAAIGSLDDRDAVAFGSTGAAPAATPAPDDGLDDLWAAAESAPAAAVPSPFAPSSEPTPPVAARPETPANPFAPRPDAPASVVAPSPAPSTSPFARTEELVPAASVAPPAADPFGTSAGPAAADPAPASTVTGGAVTFDGGFTARGDGVGRRTQRRLDAKAAKKGLFRR